MTLTSTGLVLVVDDDDSIRQAVQRLLNAAGLKNQAYATAEDLLAIGPTTGVVCIVSDFRLPGMSGLDLLTELRRRGPQPPVIVVTAHDAPELRDEAMRRGASAYLAKPFRGKDLLAAIEAASQSAPDGLTDSL
jgi:two-component system response regulator FixJ